MAVYDYLLNLRPIFGISVNKFDSFVTFFLLRQSKMQWIWNRPSKHYYVIKTCCQSIKIMFSEILETFCLIRSSSIFVNKMTKRNWWMRILFLSVVEAVVHNKWNDYVCSQLKTWSWLQQKWRSVFMVSITLLIEFIIFQCNEKFD